MRHQAEPPARHVRLREQTLRVEPAAGGLYIVATPIGHLDDISLRALTTLAGADLIACEDTRVTAKLLSRYDIRVPTIAYHDHNAADMRPRLLERLGEGAAIALVSDAGTPLVSDPGFKLVEAALAVGHRVIPIPGPSSVMAALVAAGLPTDRFFFEGFLPPKTVGRRARLTELAAIPATLVVFETGPRLAESLADMAAVLGPRPAAVCRELTKLHEDIRRAPLPDLVEAFADSAPKGEIVVVIGPPLARAPTDAAVLDAALREAMAKLSLKDAVAAVAAALDLPKKAVYRRALDLAENAE